MFSITSILSIGLVLFSAATASPFDPPLALKKLSTKGLDITPASGSLANAHEAFAKAQALGIDPAGPVPDDFESKDGNVFHFAADSKVALWAAAQGAVSIRKRQTTLEVIVFDGAACTGSGSFVDNPPLDEIFLDSKTDASVQVTAAIPAGEGILTLETDPTTGEECAVGVSVVTGGPGCAANLPAFTCFALVDGVTT